MPGIPQDDIRDFLTETIEIIENNGLKKVIDIISKENAAYHKDDELIIEYIIDQTCFEFGIDRQEYFEGQRRGDGSRWNTLCVSAQLMKKHLKHNTQNDIKNHMKRNSRDTVQNYFSFMARLNPKHPNERKILQTYRSLNYKVECFKKIENN